jgi:hypothetical protein
MKKQLIPVPEKNVDNLKRDKETGMGYQVVSVDLLDGRHFDQAIASEGCIIEVRGYNDVPFSAEEVATVSVNHRQWNFRESSDSRTPGTSARKRARSAAASN